MAVPLPLACDGETTHDPATKSLSVRVVGLGGRYWRQGHAAMMEADTTGRYGIPSVYARAGSRDIGRGEAVAGNWVRFRLADADYRRLTSDPAKLRAIAVVDKQAGQILGVRFLT